MQKALRGLETGLSGFDEIEIDGVADVEDASAARAAVVRALGVPTPDRIRVIAQAFRHGLTVEEVQAACSYEPWFLRQIADIVREEGRIRVMGKALLNHAIEKPDTVAVALRMEEPEAIAQQVELRKLKAKGFSDARIAFLIGT
ncbi:large subunit, partial [Streptomyces coelicoflavus ZG0656]